MAPTRFEQELLFFRLWQPAAAFPKTIASSNCCESNRIRTLVFIVVAIATFAVLRFLTSWFFRKYGGRVSELEAKYLLLLLFGLGGLATWAGSEAVLPMLSEWFWREQ